VGSKLSWLSHVGGSELERGFFYCKSCEVLSTKRSCEHVAHPLGGDRVVDRWCNNKHPDKGGSGGQVMDTCPLGKSQPIIDVLYLEKS
jgi:hypothetical protein